MHTPTGHLAALGERVQEEAPVVVIMKNVLPAVAPRHGVVIQWCEPNANVMCHAPLSAGDTILSRSCTLTLMALLMAL